MCTQEAERWCLHGSPGAHGWRRADADGEPRRMQTVAGSGVCAPQNKRAKRAQSSLWEDGRAQCLHAPRRAGMSEVTVYLSVTLR